VKVRWVPSVAAAGPGEAEKPPSEPPEPRLSLEVIQAWMPPSLRVVAPAFLHRGEVADGADLEIALDFDGLQHLLAGQFAGAAGQVDAFLGARDAAGLPEDLADVADAGGQVGGTERADVVAFQLGVGRRGRSQGFGLPFVVGLLGLGGADVGDERGFFRARRDRWCLRGPRGCRCSGRPSRQSRLRW
jgi:hypothetical protein